MAKIKQLAAPAIALWIAAAWMQPSVAGSDLFWHLASGRLIWERGGPPGTDPFSFTFGGREWINHEWLWDAVYYPLYALHPDLLAWFHLALLVCAFGLAFRVAEGSSRSGLAAALAVCGAAATSHWFLDVRPHVFTLFAVAIVLATRNSARAPWLWPPLLLVWANAHGGFVFGFGAIGLFTLVEALRASLLARALRVPRALALGLALAALATLINPWGYRIFGYPLAYLDADSPFRELIEWQPPYLSVDPRDFAGRFFWLAACALPGGVWLARRDPFLVGLALVSFAMAATSRRFIPLFALCSLPLAACALAALGHRVRARRAWLGSRPAAFATLGAGLALGALLWRQVELEPRFLDRWTQADLYPKAGVAFLNALGPPERVLNHYNWGGFLMLHAPKARVWIDGRANTLYDEAIFADYRQFTAGQRESAPRLRLYPADAALLPPGGFEGLLRSLPDPWIALYRDGESVVLVPPGSPLLRRAAADLRTLLELPQLRVARATQAALDGNREGARAELEAAIERDPLLIRAYGTLALLEAEAGNRDGIASAIERGLRACPRRARDLRYYEGLAYQKTGDLERAVTALRRSRNAGPFGSAGDVDVRIAKLEATLAARSEPGEEASVPR